MQAVPLVKGHSPWSAARQFARHAPSQRAYFARYQRDAWWVKSVAHLLTQAGFL